MKKIMTVFLSFILVTAMISFMGCSSDDDNPTNPEPVATSTEVPTATEVPVPVLYPFDTDQTDDWALGDDPAFSDLTYNSEEGHTAPGCMQVTGDFTTPGAKGEVQRFLGSETNFTGKTITAWINIPADLVQPSTPYGVQIFVQDESYGWDAEWFNITASGWQKYEWVLPDSLGQDITKIIQVGIQVTAGDTSEPVTSTVTILFDDITW
ncbi:MAG: hypothetical protein KA120_05670 [Candidatus Goldbacteria bacterium]|nr:hypothetical protein [Candidatus Goldiibacteriota bacterium]